VTIDMTPEMEQKLDDMARRRGMTPESLVLSAVEQLLIPAERENGKPAPGSMAEFLEGYVGVFDSRDWVPGGARLSERTGEQFTDVLQQKRREGHI
jgi:hypothetical protein